MSLYSINLISKSQKSLSKFFNFFMKFTRITQFIFINKINSRKSKKKIITILKSPHVNKKAQEQFEFGYFKYKFNVYSPQELKLILMLKKLQKKLFTDIKIEIKVLNSKKAVERKKQKIMNPLNIKFENMPYFSHKTLNLKKSLKYYDLVEKSIKSSDIYGETFLSLGSSVGRAKD